MCPPSTKAVPPRSGHVAAPARPVDCRASRLIGCRLVAWIDRRDGHCLQAGVHLGRLALELAGHAEQPARDDEIPAGLPEPQAGRRLVTEIVCVGYVHRCRPPYLPRDDTGLSPAGKRFVRAMVPLRLCIFFVGMPSRRMSIGQGITYGVGAVWEDWRARRFAIILPQRVEFSAEKVDHDSLSNGFWFSCSRPSCSPLAERWQCRHPSLLAIAGAGLAFLPFAPQIRIEPDLALALFVAPALLDAAFDTSPRGLRDKPFRLLQWRWSQSC